MILKNLCDNLFQILYRKFGIKEIKLLMVMSIKLENMSLPIYIQAVFYQMSDNIILWKMIQNL